MPVILTLLLVIWASREHLRESENGSHAINNKVIELVGIRRSICT